MNCLLPSTLEPSEPASPRDFSPPGRLADAAEGRQLRPGPEHLALQRPPRKRLQRLLGLQMDAFVAEALRGGSARVLADRIDNIVALTRELWGRSATNTRLARRDSKDLGRILHKLEAQRRALLAGTAPPADIRHALDPLLVAVLRGDLDGV